MRRFAPPEVLAMLGTYLLAGSVLMLVWACYQGTESSFMDTTSLRIRAAAVLGAVSVASAGALLWLGFARASADRQGKFWLPLVLNGFVVVIALAAIEIGLRVAASPDPLGARIGTVTLLPYDWRALADMNKELLEKSRSGTAYYVEHEMYGWTIAPNASTPDGLYQSSAEGLRSATAGVELAAHESAQRIVLVGDSFAFSEEVPFSDSLGVKLEKLLPGSQVLNLGVPGFGVDQALLRFQHEAPKWRPEVAILGFIQDDLYRNVNVYTFLKLGWQTPASKPRYVLAGGTLSLLNSPTLDPDEIFAKPSILDLPLLDHDIEFFERQWLRHPLHASYLFRYLVSALPTWPKRNTFTEDAAVDALGERLLDEFVESSVRAGVVPLIVYFPSRGDFAAQDRSPKTRVISRMNAKGTQVHDLTDCVGDAAAAGELFVEEGVHYSGAGNTVVAACLHSLIEEAVSSGTGDAQ